MKMFLNVLRNRAEAETVSHVSSPQTLKVFNVSKSATNEYFIVS